MILRMGIDIAVRAPHQASLADERGELLWSGHRFRTTVADLDALWARLPKEFQAAEVTVVMHPTRNAWVPLAAWFRRQGARVVLVSAERSSDLRAYYAKHTKSDRLDSVLLARLPLLHPEGLHPPARPWARRPVTASHQDALHLGQTPHHQHCPPRCAAGDSRPGLACGLFR